jgi:hypothetical protein
MMPLMAVAVEAQVTLAEPLRLAAGVMVATQISKVRHKEIASVVVGEQALHSVVVALRV